MPAPSGPITNREARALRAIMRGAPVDPIMAKRLLHYNLAQNSIASRDSLGNPIERALVITHEGYRRLEEHKSRVIDVWWTRILSVVALIVSITAIIVAQE